MSKVIEDIRNKILYELHKMGFEINPHPHPATSSKNGLKKLHVVRRLEILQRYNEKLSEITKIILKRYHNNVVIWDAINPKIIKVDADDELYQIFLWFNIFWWSLPYERPVGRVIRYIIYDYGNDLPIGAVQLASPILKCKARDEYLGINKENRPYWVNQSLYGHRVGAFPPYHKIGANRLVAMSLASTDLRKLYIKKYKNRRKRRWI